MRKLHSRALHDQLLIATRTICMNAVLTIFVCELVIAARAHPLRCANHIILTVDANHVQRRYSASHSRICVR